MNTFKKNLILLPWLLVVLGSAGLKLATQKPEPRALYHVLLFSWKPETSEQQLAGLDSLWTGLTQKLDGLQSYELIPLASGDYDHAVVLRFENEAAHSAYQAHEDHRRIADLGPGLVKSFAAYSYWK